MKEDVHCSLWIPLLFNLLQKAHITFIFFNTMKFKIIKDYIENLKDTPDLTQTNSFIMIKKLLDQFYWLFVNSDSEKINTYRTLFSPTLIPQSKIVRS